MRPDQLSIPNPCHEDWAAMAPRERARFCASCATEVMDVSAYRAEEALAALEGDGPRCISYLVREDGSIRFRDSPDVPLSRLRRAHAGLALAATLALASACGETARTAGAPMPVVGQVAVPMEQRTQGELPPTPPTTPPTSGGASDATAGGTEVPCEHPPAPVAEKRRAPRPAPPADHRIAGGIPAMPRTEPAPPTDGSPDAGTPAPPPPPPSHPDWSRVRGRRSTR